MSPLVKRVVTRIPRSAGSQESRALISIVIAFYNEQETIEALFREVENATKDLPHDFEYVCVNDGSRDQTLELLCREAETGRRIKVIDLARNFGKEAAISAGLANARGDAVIVMDADLQDPPALIPTFIEKWLDGYDVVYGVRASRKSDTFLKRFTAHAFYSIFNVLTEVKLPEGAGDFRLLDRRVVDVLLSLPERNRFMKGLFAWVGFRQTGVEFVRPARRGGLSGWSYLRLLNFAVDGLTSFSIVPLRMASILGGLISVGGLSYAAFLVLRTLIFGADVPGYASVMVAVLSLGGVQLLCLGLLGEYLGRLYMEAKARPLYVISEIFDNTEEDASGEAAKRPALVSRIKSPS
ncbi:MAG: glycosyltransferase family 2 protein [Proteobacteria bacterium]|nr:glycosyltransferase family 2 protein [Pseudomonadota bacterium]